MLYRAIARRGLMAVTFLILVALSLMLMGMATAAATPKPKTPAAPSAPKSTDAAYKAATDTDPHLPLTVWQQQVLREKEAKLADFYSAATGRTLTAEGASMLSATVMAASVPAAWGVAANQIPQERRYWCGPATLQEALGQCGRPNFTQTQLAGYSGTTVNGTAWSGGPTRTGFPMADVMNDRQSRNTYVPQALSYAPTAAEVATYKSRLVNTIYNTFTPVIGDAYTTKYSDYWLKGHPHDRTIMHWFDIFGYTNSGASTRYEDSVHGVSPAVIDWAPNVPAYSTMGSSQIATICGGRGYLW